ncbi:DUF2513 domain-containing protein [Xanthobacter tagetidis]|uniref:DUF2513 domain-containing protein n=1 Tax=Xanthobacter tagetidis TaxID=60216 RepID=A0A3L7AG99_9HYPH|nr:DUF2513 domain-containing protein [Xanthobacter tagetidis]MBB6306213.1 hypothetical protein [Xanthobacter tagetidis]RLP79496.1 DUF2513 domain-containing protein [Xanthobacter tagetidis]
MKNDVELTKTILRKIRDRADTSPKELQIEGFDPELVARHVERLHDDGLIVGTRFRTYDSPADRVLVRDLTTDGHLFLNAIETGDVWARIKAALSPSEIGSISLRELGDIARELASKAIKKKMGLD